MATHHVKNVFPERGEGDRQILLTRSAIPAGETNFGEEGTQKVASGYLPNLQE